MINVIVVDDEWYNLEEICELVENTGFMLVQGRYQNPMQVLEDRALISVQIAFIDIEMPGMDGITLAEKLLEIQPGIKIVFITAWNQYAVQAFELNALDYLMKPVNGSRFQKMADRIKNEIQIQEIEETNVLTINCFDKVGVYINEEPVIWKRTKAEELFYFLLMHHDTFVHKDIIIEYLWPKYEYTKALPILQTSVCKIRNVFSGLKKEVKLDYKMNSYGIFLSSASCDYFDLEQAIASYETGNPETYGKVLEACKLYRNGFLAHQGYLWSIDKTEEIRRRLISLLKDMLKAEKFCSYKTNKKEILRSLAFLAPDEEEIQFLYLQDLLAENNKKEIEGHILWLEKVLKDDYDMKLSMKIKEIDRK